jgi:hypothetical protein
MTSVIVWCYLTLSLKQFPELGGVETALRGRVIEEQEEHYLVDFSKYAREQEYNGNFYLIKVEKYKCLGDNK